MQNNCAENISKDDTNCNIELRLLNSRVLTMCGYIIAMRSETIREAKKTEEALNSLVKQTYDLRGGVWICLLTVWFLTILFIERHFY
ncbi:MAG: hypothetical protein LN588_04820 [Rickettsia endosymbiont of Bryobia graminum]|nr:hypothetical protein [Rickettsia endosymbiont of Bryobia graminum]